MGLYDSPIKKSGLIFSISAPKLWLDVSRLPRLLLLAVAVAAHELVDAACGVDELLLAGEEGVGRACDFKLYQGIGYAVYLDGLLGGHGRASDKDLVVRHIFEHYFTVVGRMDVCFHRDVCFVVYIISYAVKRRSRLYCAPIRNGAAKLRINLRSHKLFRSNFRISSRPYSQPTLTLL